MKILSIEMDDEIERAAGMSINEIFERGGEEAFRLLERKTLLILIEKYRGSEIPVVISTGGGAPCYFDNMEVMKRDGITIFINPSIDRLVERLEYKNSERPLIKNKSREEIRDFIKFNLDKRLPFYLQSHILLNPIYDDKDLNVNWLKDIMELTHKT